MGRLHYIEQRVRLIGVNELHAAFRQLALRQKFIVSFRQYIDKRVAYSEKIVGGHVVLRLNP